MRETIFDIETNGFLEHLTKIHCIALVDPSDGKVRSFGGPTGAEVRGVLSHLEDADVLIGHNILKFDIRALQKVYPEFKPKGQVRDTLIMSRLIWPELANQDFSFIRKGKPFPPKLIGKHKLEAWGYRLGENKGTYGKVGGEEVWEYWSQEMQDYCAQDVEVTLKFWKLIKSKDYAPVAIELEHQFQEYIMWQEDVGFPFDEKAAQELYSELAAKRSQLEKELHPFFPPWEKITKRKLIPKRDNKTRGYVKGVETVITTKKMITFNPRSHPQIAERLIAQRKWEPADFTDSGAPKTDGEILARLGEQWPECKLLGEHVEIQKIIGMLAEGKHAWLKVVKNGRIHGQVITNGTVTGRCAHFAPNLGQIPKEGEYGKRCRALFTAIPGYKLVGADASGLELRMLGHYMAKYDGGAYVIVVTTGDVHTVNQQAAGLPTRGNAKTFIYGWLYGAGGWKIGTIVGVTPEEIAAFKDGAGWTKAGRILEKRGIAQSDINMGLECKGNLLKDRFLKNLPALKMLKDAVQVAAKERGYLVGLDGRKLPIRSSHSALNTLLQSAGALTVKMATAFFYAKLSTRGYVADGTMFPVAHIHDEVEVLVKEGHEEEIGKLFVTCIQEAGEWFKLRCPLSGEYKIGNNWHDCH